MTGQDWMAVACVLLAAAYVVRQAVGKLSTGSCRGGCANCPAEKGTSVVPVEDLWRKRP